MPHSCWGSSKCLHSHLFYQPLLPLWYHLQTCWACIPCCHPDNSWRYLQYWLHLSCTWTLCSWSWPSRYEHCPRFQSTSLSTYLIHTLIVHAAVTGEGVKILTKVEVNDTNYSPPIQQDCQFSIQNCEVDKALLPLCKSMLTTPNHSIFLHIFGKCFSWLACRSPILLSCSSWRQEWN